MWNETSKSRCSDAAVLAFQQNVCCDYLNLSLCLLFGICYIYIKYIWNIYIFISPQWLCAIAPKWMSCHKDIVLITGRAHCFHDCIYITPVLLLWDLSVSWIIFDCLYMYKYTSSLIKVNVTVSYERSAVAGKKYCSCIHFSFCVTLEHWVLGSTSTHFWDMSNIS